MSEEHGGHRSRMRARFLNEGLSGFAPHEIMELLLFYAIPQKNVNPIAHSLLKRFGSIDAVLSAPPEELCKVEGIGEYAAVLLHLVWETHLRINYEKKKDYLVLNTSSAACSHCEAMLRGRKNEQFYAVLLSARLEVLADELLAEGSVGEVTVQPRKIVEAALRHNARFAIVCHNHPGGNASPSQNDLDVTARLRGALLAVEVELLDHLIVTEETSLSMAAHGLLHPEEKDR